MASIMMIDTASQDIFFFSFNNSSSKYAFKPQQGLLRAPCCGFIKLYAECAKTFVLSSITASAAFCLTDSMPFIALSLVE